MFKRHYKVVAERGAGTPAAVGRTALPGPATERELREMALRMDGPDVRLLRVEDRLGRCVYARRGSAAMRG